MGSGEASGGYRKEGESRHRANLRGDPRRPWRPWRAQGALEARVSGWGGAVECGEASGVLERLGGGLYIAAACRGVSAAAVTRVPLRWREQRHGEGSGRRGAIDAGITER